MARTKRVRRIMPEGWCPICFVEMELLFSTRSAWNGGRRMKLYRCECGREIPWWRPSWSVERGYVKADEGAANWQSSNSGNYVEG